jgi:hypothetical protein
MNGLLQDQDILPLQSHHRKSQIVEISCRKDGGELAGQSAEANRKPFVGEKRILSESRMLENCQSGSMSGNRKQSHVKPD